MSIINLPYGSNTFNSEELIRYILETGRNYIIQGQINCRIEVHPKPNSLDYWLRCNHTKYHDTKQAVNKVVSDLIGTNIFELGIFKCPDSGRRCKGI